MQWAAAADGGSALDPPPIGPLCCISIASIEFRISNTPAADGGSALDPPSIGPLCCISIASIEFRISNTPSADGGSALDPPSAAASACSLFVSQVKIDIRVSHFFFQKFSTRQLFLPFGNSSVVSVIRTGQTASLLL